MGLKVTNNAFGTLNAGINSSVTTVVLAAGQGALFPTLSAGDYFYATLIDTSNNLEIVKVTARSTDTMTIVRAQDNTTARAYSTNDRFELRPTAALFNETIDKADAALPKAGGVMASGGRIQFQNSDGNTLYGIRATRYGYSSSYKSLQIGNGVASDNISLGVDVSAIAGGSFTGNGKDIVVPNEVMFSMPNAGNTDFVVPMRFDTAGRVIMPLQPAFNVCNTGSASANIWTYNTTNLNRGSHMNLSNGRFTAPVAGVYFFTFGTIGTTSHTDQDIYLSINGTFLQSAGAARPDDSGAWASMSPGTGVINLSVGDYVQVYSTSSAAYSDGNCWLHFRGFFIG
jgi:hypothetical protein